MIFVPPTIMKSTSPCQSGLQAVWMAARVEEQAVLKPMADVES